MKILMVCLGNICRSPIAEGILKQKIAQKKLDWQVDSAGTSDWHKGEPPDIRSIRLMRNHGIDISNQRSRPFSIEDFNRFDVIFVMDKNNLKQVLQLARTQEEKDKVRLILDLTFPGEKRSIPDPYWDNDGFEKVYTLLDNAIDEFIRQNTSNEDPE